MTPISENLKVGQPSAAAFLKPGQSKKLLDELTAWAGKRQLMAPGGPFRPETDTSDIRWQLTQDRERAAPLKCQFLSSVF
jgi:hypothetical protein